MKKKINEEEHLYDKDNVIKLVDNIFEKVRSQFTNGISMDYNSKREVNYERNCFFPLSSVENPCSWIDSKSSYVIVHFTKDENADLENVFSSVRPNNPYATEYTIKDGKMKNLIIECYANFVDYTDVEYDEKEGSSIVYAKASMIHELTHVYEDIFLKKNDEDFYRRYIHALSALTLFIKGVQNSSYRNKKQLETLGWTVYYSTYQERHAHLNGLVAKLRSDIKRNGKLKPLGEYKEYKDYSEIIKDFRQLESYNWFGYSDSLEMTYDLRSIVEVLIGKYCSEGFGKFKKRVNVLLSSTLREMRSAYARYKTIEEKTSNEKTLVEHKLAYYRKEKELMKTSQHYVGNLDPLETYLLPAKIYFEDWK